MVTLQNKNSDKYADLARLFRAEDAASYTLFLQTIAPLMRRLACRKLSPADAEDTCQEILISIHKARHTYDGERPIMPWLLAIAQFRINDCLRKTYAGSRHESVDIDELAEVLADVTKTGTDDESIENILKDVAEREQRILTMMHVDGYTAKETGAQLGMTESAVKVAAHRAIKKIREAFRL